MLRRLVALAILLGPALVRAQSGTPTGSASPAPPESPPPPSSTKTEEVPTAPPTTGPAPSNIADTPPLPVDVAPTDSPSAPVPSPAAPPAANLAVAAPVAVPVAASVTASAPRFFAAPFLLVARLQAGFEPHSIKCDPQAVSTCTVTTFSVGGEALWHGLVGASLGLYASAGSPVAPIMPPGLPDRVSTAIALSLRPLATLGWKRGDTFVARLLGGIGIEIGPSVEYLRTSSATIAGCAIPATVTQVGLHAAASVEVPLLGDARTGWLSLRISERLLVNSTQDLAPTIPGGTTTCVATIHAPGTIGQTLFGLAYSF